MQHILDIFVFSAEFCHRFVASSLLDCKVHCRFAGFSSRIHREIEGVSTVSYEWGDWAMIQRNFRNICAGGVALGVLMAASPALAQEVEDVAAEAAEDVVEIVEEAPAADEFRQEKITVTGSLIARDEFSSASPIQIITAEVATLEGLVDTASLLQGSSLASGSTQLNNTFQNFVTNGGVGAQTLDLRGCGDTRTLVLLDGKRPGASGTRGAVSSLDLNVIPQSIVERIEILKDGASTIYGSDAVCGVVNIITRDSVDGFEVNGTISQPFESGGEEYNLSAAYGFGFGDSAEFTLSAEYRVSEELDISQRDYLSCPRDLVRSAADGSILDRQNYSATATDPTRTCNNLYHNTVIDAFSGERLVPSPDGLTVPTAFGGVIPGYRPRIGTGTLPDGTLYYEDILDAAVLGNTDYRPKLENISLFATADVELGAITWDTELLYNQRTVDVEGWRQFFPLIGSATNPAGNNPFYGYINDPSYSNSLGSLVRPVLPFATSDTVDVDFFYGATSFAGDFGSALNGWGWKIDGTFSRSEGTYSGNEILSSQSGDWGLDGVGGVLISPPSVDFLDPGFLDGSRADELVAAISGNQSGKTVYEQKTITAVASGEAFELPAGPLGVGIGVEYREFSIDDQPGELTQSGDIWGSSTAGPTVGENSVTEAFVEISAPLIKGAFLAEDVELSASARAFEYDLGGSDSIYKVGLNWQMSPTFRMRSSYGTSYRAPALFELFLEDQTSFASQTSIDPCIDWGQSNNANIQANCAAAGIPATYAGGSSSALLIESGGGELLEAESGDSLTIGAVWTPTFIDLNIALDYYEIEINDQITSLSGAQIVGGCYATTTFPNDFCNLFDRAPATDAVAPFSLDNILAPTLNVDSQQQRGIDLEVRYVKDFDLGTLTVDTSVNWALERYINVFGSDFVSGVTDDDYNGSIGYPSVVGDATVKFERGDWTYTWFTNYMGRQDDNRYFADDLNGPSSYFGEAGLYKVYTEAMFTHGASVRWEGETLSLTAGINNLFDEQPPQVSDLVQTSAGNTAANATGYDYLGRRAFLTVSKTF